MARVKRGNVARKRRNKILRLARGFRGGNGTLFRTANQRVMKALCNAYRDRRRRKRDFRRLWIARINAAARLNGVSYSRLMGGLKKLLETAHQTAVAHTIQAGCGVDAGNPEATEIALATTTIAVGVAEGFHHPLVCCTEQGSVATTEATGQPQDFVAAFTGDVASLDAGHEVGRVGSGLVERSRLSSCAQA